MLKDTNLIKELEVLETLNEKELREISAGRAGEIILNPIAFSGLSVGRLMIGTWPTPERSLYGIDTVPLPE